MCIRGKGGLPAPLGQVCACLGVVLVCFVCAAIRLALAAAAAALRPLDRQGSVSALRPRISVHFILPSMLAACQCVSDPGSVLLSAPGAAAC